MPESSADYLARCDALEAQGRAAIEGGDTARGLALLDQAAQALGTAIALRKLEDLRAQLESRQLPSGSQATTLEGMNTQARAVSLSIGRTETSHPFVRAMHAAGYTARSLALKAKFSPQMLQKALNGERRLSDEKREKIEALVGAAWETGEPLKRR